MSETLRPSPLDNLHRRLGARMIGFAGWSLPVQFAGTLSEHAACRQSAALFDVSHMGQLSLRGPAVAQALETLVPGDMALKPGRQRYTLLLNPAGGIIDDLMVASYGDRFFLVVNAAGTDADLAHLRAGLPGVEIQHHRDRALLALQGPQAAAVLARHAAGCDALPFMGTAEMVVAGIPAWISRSGYTGEDGYEISVAGADAETLARVLLAEPGVAPAGLAARDTLRLEAGLCLHGHDIDATTTPAEADLGWAIGKRRRLAADFPGAAIVIDQLARGPSRIRVGLRPLGRTPVRAGAEILLDGEPVGRITSGTVSPSLGAPIAMGYLRPDLAHHEGLNVAVRGQLHPVRTTPLPFVPHRYFRPQAAPPSRKDT